MTTAEKLLPRDTRTALQSLPVKDCSRSLYFDRFSRPDLDKDDRKQFFTTGFDAHRSSVRAENWAVAMRLDPAQRLYAQLQSRLMVNMAGGVMENAGLCLDRFGLPYIPGSAVKGCARRAALAALHEWCETGVKPADKENEKNLFTDACASFNSPAEMLAAIARVFGWSEQEWKTREDVLKNVSPLRGEDDPQFQQRCQKLWEEKRSDFAWACDISPATTSQTPAPTGRSIPAQGNALGNAPNTNPSPVGAAQTPAIGWPAIRAETRKLLGNAATFAGSISFFPAHLVNLPKGKIDGLSIEIPELGKLELDVVTCHHGEYYKSDNPNAIATDTEDPVPVFFPAVASGHIFAFALRPLRGADAALVTRARTWLANGLATFGLGAKTAAGYGWFDDVTQHVKEANAKVEAAAVAKAACIADEKRKEEARRKMPPEQRACDDFLGLVRAGKQQDFAEKARLFASLDETARKGFVLALRVEKDTAKRWKKNKPELIRPWIEFAATMNPPIPL